MFVTYFLIWLIPLIAQADEEDNLRPFIPVHSSENRPLQTKGVFWQFMERGAAFATLELATDAMHSRICRLEIQII